MFETEVEHCSFLRVKITSIFYSILLLLERNDFLVNIFIIEEIIPNNDNFRKYLNFRTTLL